MEGFASAALLHAISESCVSLSRLSLLGQARWSTQRYPSMFVPQLRAAGCVLSNLDIGRYTLTSELWDLLPRSLKHLRGTLPHISLHSIHQLTDLSQHRGLQSFGCVCHEESNNADLYSLLSVIHAAPGLSSVVIAGSREFSNMPQLDFHLEMDGELEYLRDLHDRMLQGNLEVISTTGHKDVQGICIHIVTGTDALPEELPRLPGFTSLVLSVHHEEFPAISKAFSSVFPGTTTLDIRVTDPQSLHAAVPHMDLSHLLRFKALQHLTLRHVHIGPRDLAFLCCRLTSLKSLCLKNTAEILEELDVEGLQSLLHKYNLALKIQLLPSSQ